MSSGLVLVMIEHRERFLPFDCIPCARTVITTVRGHAETWNKLDTAKPFFY